MRDNSCENNHGRGCHQIIQNIQLFTKWSEDAINSIIFLFFSIFWLYLCRAS